MPFGERFIHLLRPFIENGREESNVLERYKEHLFQVGRRTSVPVDSKTEEKVVLDLLKQVSALVESNYGRQSMSEEQRKRAQKYAWHCPFEDTELHLYVLDALIALQRCYDFLSVQRSMSRKLDVPSTLQDRFDNKDDLINLSHFESLNRALLDRRSGIVLYPSVSDFLRNRLLFLQGRANRAFDLSVRAQRFGRFEDYSDYVELMEERTYGIAFTVDNLQTLQKKTPGSFEYCFKNESEQSHAEFWFVPLKRLEYVLKPASQNRLSISIEEIIDIECESFRHLEDYVFRCGTNILVEQRLVHAEFSPRKKIFTHLDLSHLYYDAKQYERRLEQHIKSKTVKANCRVKRYRLDGEIPLQDFSDLVSLSLDATHNPEVVRLLEGG